MVNRYADHIYRSYQVEKYGISPADAEEIVRTLRSNDDNYNENYKAWQNRNAANDLQRALSETGEGSLNSMFNKSAELGRRMRENAARRAAANASKGNSKG